MVAAWFAAVANSSIDIVFARMGVLDNSIAFNLTNYDGSLDDIEYLLKVNKLACLNL
jgi:hypothetical protein